MVINRMKIYKNIVNFIIIISIILRGFSVDLTPRASEPDRMEVHFMDVGQGDAALITCGGHSMLIDAGDASKGTAIQNYLQNQNIEKLDYLVLTHPDTDHIGGAPVIITKFEIDNIFVSNYEKDNDSTYFKLIQALDNKQLEYMTPEADSRYLLGTAEITVLNSNDEYDNPNDSSIILMIQNGNNRFLFTGDAGEAAERDILNSNRDISADVYKAGHHGSKTSSSREFVKAVNPDYAIISCGENNYYGLPNAETLNTFRVNGIKVYRTDEEGTIIAVSDGKNITFNVPPSKTWKVGEPAASGSVSNGITYVLNNNTGKFHKPGCDSVDTMKPKNREDTTKSRDEIIESGYVPCKKCKP